MSSNLDLRSFRFWWFSEIGQQCIEDFHLDSRKLDSIGLRLVRICMSWRAPGSLGSQAWNREDQLCAEDWSALSRTSNHFIRQQSNSKELSEKMPKSRSQKSPEKCWAYGSAPQKAISKSQPEFDQTHQVSRDQKAWYSSRNQDSWDTWSSTSLWSHSPGRSCMHPWWLSCLSWLSIQDWMAGSSWRQTFHMHKCILDFGRGLKWSPQEHLKWSRNLGRAELDFKSPLLRLRFGWLPLSQNREQPRIPRSLQGS